ncbi:hypothetical protein ABNX05_05140 [Lysinibacillus sp. M3]|uniref:Uncharacterized protein n=1 Tax=Lysinibacillus zambalensis TaxID=3160866 RepID=A0ABV1MQ09_9BACI
MCSLLVVSLLGAFAMFDGMQMGYYLMINSVIVFIEILVTNIASKNVIQY